MITLLVPAVRVWFFGQPWPLEKSYVEVATNLAVLCFVGLMISHSQADLRREIAVSSRTRAMLSGILNSVPQSVFWKDRNSVYLGGNQVFARAVGLDRPEDVAGKTDYDFPWPRAEAEKYRAQDREVMETGVPLLHVVQLRRQPDGKPIWVDMSTLPLRDAHGRAYGLLGVSDDITDRRLAEQERANLLVREQAARKEAEVASAAKDHFIAVLSHELRTPLTPVLMTLKLWRDSGALDPSQHDDLKMLIRNVQLEASLIDDLLDITRISQGKLHLHRIFCDLHALVRETAEMFRGLEGAEIVVDLPPGEAVVEADPVRIRQVIWNFLSNARKFTPPDGRITVRAGRSQDEVWVRVTDTGIGIAPDQIAGLFSAFVQGAGREVRPQGLGLGLAISRAIAQAHGGEITCSSEGLGKGTEFTLRLPIPRVAPAPSPRVEQPAPASAPPTGRSILLVEDHPDTARVLCRLLGASGYDVRPAHSVAEAREVLAHWTPDLMVSDLGLPDGSGHELMRELRGRAPTVRGIAVSGYGTTEDVQRSEESGFARHLTKPVTPTALLDAISQVLQGETVTDRQG
jgi:PAS domain S-box-containing protein